jgi:ribosomal protein S18 acetylase RimI-like enzyme
VAEIRRVTDGIVPDPLDEVFDDTFSPERLAQRAAVDGHLLVVAVEGGRTVGQVAGIVQHLAHKPAELHLENVGVAPSHRRRGIAAAMVTEALAWGGELGCDEAWVATEVDNDAANELYTSLGSRSDPALIHVFTL